MSDTYRAVIPYESLDPLTIGSADDPAMVYRETLTLDIPEANLLAALYPDEPAPLANPTEAAAEALEAPAFGPPLSSRMLGPDKSLAIVIDNQFRPTPTSKLLPAVLDAVEAHGVRGRARRLRQRQGLPHVRARHRAQARAGRTSRAWSGSASPSFQNEPRDPEAVCLHRHDHRRHAGLGCTRRSRSPTCRFPWARRSPTTGAPAAAES